MNFGKKKDVNYFELLNKMSDCACRAAHMLDDMLKNYTNVSDKAEAVHDIEHEADNLLHTLTKQLNAAFITPIEREDILLIGNGIDSIIDAIEDVANSFDMLSIKKVQPEMIAMTELLISACDALSKAVKEFEAFRNSKRLNSLVIDVNHIEEKADVLYRSTIKSLYNNTHMSVLEVFKCKEIYDYMERIFDSCEDVADALESTAIKNK